jgi:hypothetical protein
MLLSFQAASRALLKLSLALPGMSAMAAAVFLFPLYKGVIPTSYLLYIVIGAAAIGLLLGIYVTFQETFSSSYGLGVFFYWFIVFEILFCSGAVVTAARIAGRIDLKWLFVFSYLLTMIVTLLGGMYNEVKALKLSRTDQLDEWKEKLKKHIDFSNRLVRPSLTVDPRSLTDGQGASSSMWIGAALSVNIPLLFEIYGGGRYNAIFFVIPLMMGTFAYLHITLIGPGLMRLLLLRKLEKSVGYRFINADLEQIQELRRTFFLSRWLMKDYVKPPSASSVVQANLKS